MQPEPSHDDAQPHGPAWPVRLVCALALALATLLAFGGAVRNGWVSIDDPAYVTAQPAVLAGLTRESIAWAFTHPHGGNWHPLTSLTHMLDVELFGRGPDGVPSPAGPHAVNVALHALASVLLLFALTRLTRAWWPSLAVAALYALHPLRVESVAWIAERKDVLSAVGFMLTLWAYAHWCARPSVRRYLVLVLALAIGLMSKPMLVTTPFVLLLLDLWPLARWPQDGGASARVREKLPLFAMAALVVAMTLDTQRVTGAVTTLAGLPLETRAANAVVSYARYLGALVWPAGLAVIRPHPRAIEWSALALASALLLALAALAWQQRARRPWLAVGYAWFLGMLVPVIGLVQVGRQGWADRYTQLPCIGVLIALVWTVREWASGSALRQRLSAALTCALCAVLALLTQRQVTRWQDSVTLFTHTVRVTGPNPFAELGLGGALMQAGRANEAEPHLARAVLLEPADNDARERWATALLQLGRIDSARTVIRDGLERGPWRGGYERLGVIEMRAGNAEAAVTAYRGALAEGAPSPALELELARAHQAAGQTGEAIDVLTRLVTRDPRDVRALAALADALDDAGRAAEALARYRQVLQWDPHEVAAYVRAGWLLAASPDARVRDGAEALRMAAHARANLPAGQRVPAVLLAMTAAAHAEAGEWREAVANAQAAVTAAEAEQSPGEVALYREQLRLHEAKRPLRIGE